MYSISKVDGLRNHYRKTFEEFRKYLVKLSEKDQELAGQKIPVGALKASNAEGIANVVMLHSQKTGKQTNEQAALIPLFVEIVDGTSRAFVFNNKKLVDDILSQEFIETKASDIEFIDNNFLIELPCKIKQTEEFSWDIASVKKSTMPVVFDEGKEPENKECWIFTFVNSHSDYESKWFVYIPKENHVFSDKEILNEEHFDKEIGHAIIQTFKLMKYMISDDAKQEIVNRDKFGKKASSLIKNAFLQKTIVS